MADVSFYNNGYIVVYFENAGVPQTGLSVTLDVYNVATGLKVLDSVSMDEIGGGLYKYYFSGYNNEKNYAAIIDGSASLTASDRYTAAFSGSISVINKTKTGIDNLYLSLRDWMQKVEIQT